MTATYTFKVSSPLNYIKSVSLSLVAPGMFALIVLLIFSRQALYNNAGSFFFAGGALWLTAFMVAIYSSGKWMECEIGDEGLILNHKSKSRFYRGKTEELDWNHLASYSIMQDGNGTLLLVKLRNPDRKKWITIPLINNDGRQIEQFLNDFQKYAAHHNAEQTLPEKKIKKGRSFYETLLARVIGYFIMAYLLFITVIKMTGLDAGRIPTSNVISTFFFASMYLLFVFWKRKNN